MGANRTQALGLVLFLIAFVFFSGGAAGGGVIAWLIGLVVLGASLAVFRKARPWEYE